MSATVGKLRGSSRFAAESGGQGAAVKTVADVSVAVFTVVNAVGAIIDEDGGVLRGFLDRETGQRHRLETVIADPAHELTGRLPSGGNTTLTAVVVDREIPPNELQQIGRQTHAAMARVIQPFHTLYDGDILFALSMGAKPTRMDSVAIGEIASSLACAAVRSAVMPAGGEGRAANGALSAPRRRPVPVSQATEGTHAK